MRARLFFLIVFNVSILYSQNNIIGKIWDEKSDSIEYANVILLSEVDSAFVTGTYTDNQGHFIFKNIDIGAYIIKISYLGYEDYYKKITLLPQDNDIGAIQLTPATNLLKEVIIISKVPPFQTSNNGLIANVSTTLLSSLGTASDVIQRIPGIMKKDDKITVFGKGAPIVYINNRKVRDMSELEGLESSEISTVELITNPGAKYDAEGHAVLLIKTKNKQNGFSAQITERMRYGYYLGDNENANFSYTKDNFNIFVSYFHRFNKLKVEEEHSISLLQTDSVWQNNILTPLYPYSNNSNQASAGIDWNLNDNNIIGVQYQYNKLIHESPITIKSSTYLNNALYDDLFSSTLLNENRYQHLANFFYKGNFGKRFSLQFDFDYLNNHSDRQQYTEESSNLENRVVNTISQSDYNLYASKLTNNYQTSIGLIEFGGEYSNITGNGFVLNSEGYTDNNIFSNQEQKTAFFIAYSHQLGNIKLNAGLRYEFTRENYMEDSIKITVVDQKYSDIYPNLNLSTKINNCDLRLSFNKRTQRPGFSQLNGNTVYINRFVFQKGYPYLKKSNIYNVNLELMYKIFFFNLEYSYEKNPFYTYFVEQTNKLNSILSTYTNYPKYQEIKASLNFNKKISFWQPNYTIEICKPYFSFNYNGDIKTYNQPNYEISAYNDFVLPASIIISCNFIHYSDYNYYLTKVEGNNELDFGIRKSFYNNRLRLNLDIFDIFNWVNVRNKIMLNNIYWETNKKRETKYVQLSISYQFNSYKEKYRNIKAAGDDLKRF
jgi:hypothetical protein